MATTIAIEAAGKTLRGEISDAPAARKVAEAPDTRAPHVRD